MSEQGTEQWVNDRLGKATGSRISDVVARTKTGWGASRANYAAELVAERLTGTPYPQYVSQPMAWGIQHEADAVSMYALMNDAEIEKVGFVPHKTILMSGASPDRLVGEHGLAEFKCPNTSTHLATLMGTPIAREYIIQMQYQMACTGRLWCDFNSYDPRMPPKLRLFTHRVHMDPALIRELEGDVRIFLREIDDQVTRLEQRYGVKAVLNGRGS